MGAVINYYGVPGEDWKIKETERYACIADQPANITPSMVFFE